MNKEEKKLLYEILEIMINRQERINKQTEILQNEIKLLNTKINILKKRQCKGCCKGCGQCSK